MILLDTNIVSEIMKTNPNQNVRTWLRAQIIETLFLSSVSIAEISFGIEILPAGKKKQNLIQEFEKSVLPNFDNRILDFDREAAKAFAILTAQTRKKGLAVGMADVYIGAIASSKNLTIATRDTSPFVAMQLKVVNPFEFLGN